MMIKLTRAPLLLGMLAVLSACDLSSAPAEVSQQAASTDVVVGAPLPAATEGDAENIIRQRFERARPGLKLESLQPSPVAGLYQVELQNGPTLYVTADGGHFVVGDLYAVADDGFVNLAEQAREGDRAVLLAKADPATMIIFAPKERPVKAVVNVFTDVDCFYCQKLHKEMADINRLGIEVRYLAFPRAGIGSQSYKKIASAWCADDQQAAMTALKNKQSIPINVCDDNPVAAHYQLGQDLGVSGTPAMLTADGRLMPGYLPALQLASTLGIDIDPDVVAELHAQPAAVTDN